MLSIRKVIVRSHLGSTRLHCLCKLISGAVFRELHNIRAGIFTHHRAGSGGWS
jgi:hypothetical protein